MCLAYYFFPTLTFYLILLIFSTISKKTLGYQGVLSIFALFLSMFLAFLINTLDDFFFFSAVSSFKLSIITVDWLSLDISISLKIDYLSYIFVLLFLAIGLATNVYITKYLNYEANKDTFVLLINWFIFSMIILVLANNLLTLLLGWESIGLSSFFLINFWSSRRRTVKSSFKAFFFYELIDVFLYLLLTLFFILILN